MYAATNAMLTVVGYPLPCHLLLMHRKTTAYARKQGYEDVSSSTVALVAAALG